MKYCVYTLILCILCVSGCGSKKKQPVIMPELIEIPAGPFVIGASLGFLNTFPPKQIELDAYKISKCEITTGQFCQFLNEVGDPDEKFVDVSVYSLVQLSNGEYYPMKKNVHNESEGDYSNLPVNSVSYDGALAFCDWISKKTGKKITLPTEAQWEKAAGWDPEKNGKVPFPWGTDEQIDKRAYFTMEKKMPCDALKPVDSMPEGASPYGCLHMADNVSEWCLDNFNDDYYTYIEAKNPVCTKESRYKSIRGASWMDGRNQAFVICRSFDFHDSCQVNYGFRIICEE